MLAEQCRCEQPRLLEPPTCHRCGRDTAVPVTASTWNLALAIGEVMMGARKTGDQTGHHARRGGNAGKHE